VNEAGQLIEQYSYDAHGTLQVRACASTEVCEGACGAAESSLQVCRQRQDQPGQLRDNLLTEAPTFAATELFA
jgi:hypothetical protein